MSLTLTEARARAALLTVRSYDVHLDLSDTAAFTSTSTVRFGCHEPGAATFAELAGAAQVTGALNGAPLPATAYAGGRLALDGLAAENELTVAATLPHVSDGEGMHAFTDPADGERYLTAYCGMDVAQKVFACFDQPDLKATIALTVDAPEAWTVLGNGVATEADGAAPGLRRWRFTVTPPISTYLFVVCAGPWASIRFEHAGLPFGWHARASLRAELERDSAELVAITRACFDHYTGVFAPAYAFDSYDQVMAPGLNWGALETPGCVTFRDEFLPRGVPSADQRLERAMVIAHEMAHMWFGDLVTMRWWEDSWLNESFADYMGYQVAGRAAGFDGAWTGCALARKPTAYVADARRSTHPVAEDTEAMTDVETALGNFDMITYAKGNAVLRQLVTWLGEEQFLAGVNGYLSGHALGNADLADFLTALDGATERDVRGWAAAWLRSTGFDTVRVEHDGAVPVLSREGSRPHRFHVGGYDDTGALVAGRLVDLADEPVPLPELAGLAILPNDHDETYARLHLDDRSWATLSARLSAIADPLTRALLWATAIDMAATARLPVASLGRLAADQLPAEPDPIVLENVLDLLLRRVLRQYAAPAEVAPLRELVAGACRRVLAGTGEDRHAAVLRTLAASSADADELTSWLDRDRTATGQAVDADVRWTALRRLAALDALPEDRLAAELDRDHSHQARLGALHARAARPDPAAKEEAWALMHAADVANRDYEALAAGFWTPGQADLVAPWLDRYLDVTPETAVRRGAGYAGAVLGRTFPLLPLPSDALRSLREGVAERLDGLPTALRRSWSDRLDDLDVMLRVRRGADA